MTIIHETVSEEILWLSSNPNSSTHYFCSNIFPSQSSINIETIKEDKLEHQLCKFNDCDYLNESFLLRDSFTRDRDKTIPHDFEAFLDEFFEEHLNLDQNNLP